MSRAERWLRNLRRISTTYAGYGRGWYVLIGIAAVAIGLTLADDYGPAYDESAQMIYGNEALDSYLTFTAPDEWHGNLEYYGPSYSAAVAAAVRFGELFNTRWYADDISHLVTFISLPVAAYSIFLIAKRWVSISAASLATLLFATQPLFFGHAFMNQKDMPFLAAFTLSVALGLWMSDKVDRKGMWISGASGSREIGVVIRSQIASLNTPSRVLMFALVSLAALVALELLVIQSVILRAIQDLVFSAYGQNAWRPLNELFSRFAEQSASLPVESYVEKSAAFYERVRRPISVLGFTPAAILAFVLMLPILRMIKPRWLLVATLAAGISLGVASSIRVVGPLAGVLVSGIVLFRGRRGSILPLVLYWSIAGAATYALWPYLWEDPIGRYWESLQVMRNFEWEFPVLFQGVVHKGSDLPRTFLPVIYTLQMTIPAILLGLVGALATIRQSMRNPTGVEEKVIVGLWLLVPLAMGVLAAPAFYDNGRQYLFTLPPVFLFASIGISILGSTLRSKGLQLALSALVLLPGILGIIRLHPYQYVFYNELVGGSGGAFRQYELDYWATSYQQAVETLNDLAPPDSSVYLHGTWHSWRFARPDLQAYDPPENEFNAKEVGFAIVSTRANGDRLFLGEMQPIGSVTIDGVPLTVIFGSADQE